MASTNQTASAPRARLRADHLRHGAWQWFTVVGLATAALVLGMIGFLQPLPGGGAPRGLLDALYNTLCLFHLHCDATGPLSWQLQIARFLAPFALAVTLFKGFFYVSHLHFWRLFPPPKQGHVVVCGLGEKGLQALLACGKDRVVVIEKDEHNPSLRLCDARRIAYWIGDAADLAILRATRAASAKQVIAVTPDDVTNVQIAMKLRELTAGMANPPQCLVHLEDAHLRQSLIQEWQDQAVTFFDIYAQEAKQVLGRMLAESAAQKPPHVVILGFGRMGRAIGLEAAKPKEGRPAMRVSVIDRHARRQEEQLRFHFPGGEAESIGFHEMEVQSGAAREKIDAWAAEPSDPLWIFVCVDDDGRGVEIGLVLHQALAGPRAAANCTIFVRIKREDALEDWFKRLAKDGPALQAFGQVDKALRHAIAAPG